MPFYQPVHEVQGRPNGLPHCGAGGSACVPEWIATFTTGSYAHRSRLTTYRSRKPLGLLAALLCAIPMTGLAQGLAPLDWNGKLRYHAERTYGPWAIAGSAAYAGLLQEFGTPEPWGQGAAGYGKRLASTLACSGMHGVLAFGLDSALHQDPRYYPSHTTGFWRRAGHAFRGTILTRTDRGDETFSTWRFGSAYGAAFLSNQWYPQRYNTVRLGLLQGSLQIGFDLASNLFSEFRQDLKRAISRRKS